MKAAPDELEFRKSSKCEASGCLEVAFAGDRVVIRDSARPMQTLEVSKADWDALVAGVRAGEFDS